MKKMTQDTKIKIGVGATVAAVAGICLIAGVVLLSKETYYKKHQTDGVVANTIEATTEDDDKSDTTVVNEVKSITYKDGEPIDKSIKSKNVEVIFHSITTTSTKKKDAICVEYSFKNLTDEDMRVADLCRIVAYNTNLSVNFESVLVKEEQETDINGIVIPAGETVKIRAYGDITDLIDYNFFCYVDDVTIDLSKE